MRKRCRAQSKDGFPFIPLVASLQYNFRTGRRRVCVRRCMTQPPCCPQHTRRPVTKRVSGIGLTYCAFQPSSSGVKREYLSISSLMSLSAADPVRRSTL